MRRREIDPPRSFWSVLVTPDDGADLNYIADRYGSPCGAWGHSQGYGWY